MEKIVKKKVKKTVPNATKVSDYFTCVLEDVLKCYLFHVTCL